jgi:hypothetical protein
MKLAHRARWLAASVLISAAGLYAFSLAGILLAMGLSHRPEVHRVVYLGVAVAILFNVGGYALAGRIRESAPDSIALLLLGVCAQPFAVALAAVLQSGYWAIAAFLFASPFLVLLAGVYIRRRLFDDRQIPSNKSLERTHER